MLFMFFSLSGLFRLLLFPCCLGLVVHSFNYLMIGVTTPRHVWVFSAGWVLDRGTRAASTCSQDDAVNPRKGSEEPEFRERGLNPI